MCKGIQPREVSEGLVARLREKGLKYVDILPKGTISVQDDSSKSLPEWWTEYLGKTWLMAEDYDVYTALDVEPGCEKTKYELFNPCYRYEKDSEGVYRSIAMTNLPDHAKIHEPFQFLLLKLGVVFSPRVSPALRSRFCEGYGLRLLLGCRVYREYPLAGLFSVNQQDEENPELPVKAFVSFGEVPVIIPGGMSFQVDLQGYKAVPVDQKLRLWVVLSGLCARTIC
jgi:hypothetical protein